MGRLDWRVLRRIRALCVTAGVVVLAIEGRALEALFRGPRWVEGFEFAVAIGLLLAVVMLVFSLVVRWYFHRMGDPSYRVDVDQVLFLSVGAALAAALCWTLLASTGRPLTLVVIPLFVLPIIVSIERTDAPLSQSVPLGDKAIERRLMRFAREAGAGTVQVCVSDQGWSRSATNLFNEADVLLFGSVVMVPNVIVEAGPDVLVTRLARSVVRIRSSRNLREAPTQVLVAMAVIALLGPFADAVRRVFGVPTLDSPSFVPVATLVVMVGIVTARRLMNVVKRRNDLAEVDAILDLTRDPAAFLRSSGLEADAREPRGRVMRLLHPLPTQAQLKARVEAWQRARRMTLLFTDVVSSTEAVNRLGDEGWYDVLADHDHIVREVIEEFHGEEIDKAGDGFLIVFGDSGQAVLAAVEMQRRLRDVLIAPESPIGVRMGVHTGEAIRRGRELVGREVHLAARIGACAAAGEILVSDDVREELSGASRFEFAASRVEMFKGFDESHVVVPVVWTIDAPQLSVEP